MSRFDYEAAKQIAAQDPPFYALVMAAMLRADNANLAKLEQVFPETAAEVRQRYYAIGGRLPGEPA